MRPDMLYLWALTQLARDCVVLRAARHAPRVYQALAPYAGRAAVAAGAVMCSGSTDFYLAGLAALSGDTAAADRHYRAAVSCHRRLGARPMLAHTLHEHARLLGTLPPRRPRSPRPGPSPPTAACPSCSPPSTRPNSPANPATSPCVDEDDFWLVGFADTVTRVPDSLGLRYLDLLVRQPGRDLAALDLVRLAAAAGAAAAAAERRTARRVRNRGRRGPRPAGPGRLPAAPRRARRGPRRSRGVARHRAGQPTARREGLPGPRARRRDRAGRQATAPRRGIRTRPAQRHPGHQGRDRQDPRPRPGRRRPPRPVRPDRHPLLLLPAERAEREHRHGVVRNVHHPNGPRFTSSSGHGARLLNDFHSSTWALF